MLITKVIAHLIFIILISNTYATTLTVQVKKPNHSFLIRENKNFLEFRPNSSLHWGVKVAGSFFYIQYGQKIKNTNYTGNAVGNDSYGDYKIGFSIKNTYTEIFYKEYKGFSSDESDRAGCDFCFDRPNLGSRERNFAFTWALNESFNMFNLSSSGNGGAEEGNSWIIGLIVNRLTIRDPGTLLQGNKSSDYTFYDDVIKLNMKQLGLGIGYAFIQPFGPFYISLGGLIGPGYQSNDIQKTSSNNSHNGVSAHWSLKTNIATQGLWINGGIKGLFFSNIYKLGGSQNLASINYSLYAYLTHQF